MPSPVAGPVPDASPARRGLLSAVAQTIAGVKSLVNPLRLARLLTPDLPSGAGAQEGMIAYNLTEKKLYVYDGADWKAVSSGSSSEVAEALAAHLASTAAHGGASITYDAALAYWANNVPFGPLDVQSAIWNIVTLLRAVGGATKLGANPYATLVSTTIQGQLYELEYNKVNFWTLVGTGGAGFIGAADAGDLTSTTVQGQLYQLNNQKVKKADLASADGAGLVGNYAKTGMTFFQLAAGTVRAQLEQLLLHVNNVRSDQVPQTQVPLNTNFIQAPDPFGPLTYAKDCGGWGHVMGAVHWIGSTTFLGTVGNIPLESGCRPLKTVTIKTDAIDYIGGRIGFDAYNILAHVDPDGTIWIDGAPAQTRIYLNFPSYKCA